MSAARKEDSSGSSVSTDASTPGDGIHKCETVPPPDGEDDAYSAPTKVGPLALVEQLMAQAENMAGSFDSAPPPKSGERPLPARTAPASKPPVLVMPAPPSIPRVHDDIDDESGDQLEPTSLHPQAQSGGTEVIEVDVRDEALRLAAAAAAAKASSAPPSDVPLPSPEAYVASLAPAPSTSGAGLVIAVCAVVTLGLAALYFIFLAA